MNDELSQDRIEAARKHVEGVREMLRGVIQDDGSRYYSSVAIQDTLLASLAQSERVNKAQRIAIFDIPPPNGVPVDVHKAHQYIRVSDIEGEK